MYIEHIYLIIKKKEVSQIWCRDQDVSCHMVKCEFDNRHQDLSCHMVENKESDLVSFFPIFPRLYQYKHINHQGQTTYPVSKFLSYTIWTVGIRIKIKD